jgi:phytoene dehydrogenase-like protein
MPTLGKRILVIGSGFGGLGAAIRLQARGYQVELLEARDKLGGRAYMYEQDGFRFDGGPTVITAPFLIRSTASSSTTDVGLNTTRTRGRPSAGLRSFHLEM